MAFSFTSIVLELNGNTIQIKKVSSKHSQADKDFLYNSTLGLLTDLYI